MARTARKKSKTGINHIIFRGINYLDIFLEMDDFKEYMNRLIEGVMQRQLARILGVLQSLIFRA